MKNETEQSQPGPEATRELQRYKKLQNIIVYTGLLGGLVLGAILTAVRQASIYIGLGMALGCLLALVVMIVLSVRRSIALQNKRKLDL